MCRYSSATGSDITIKNLGFLQDEGSKNGDPVDVFLQQTVDRHFKVSAKSKNGVEAKVCCSVIHDNGVAWYFY